MTGPRGADGERHEDVPPKPDPPPLDEPPGSGQFYFPGRRKGCASVLLLALIAGALVAAAAG